MNAHAYISVEEAAARLGKTPRWVQQLCNRGDILGARKVRGYWQIPAREIERSRTAATQQDRLAQVPQVKLEQAKQRLGYVEYFEKFAAGYVRQGGRRTDAYDIYAEQQGIGARSLRRWIRDYKQEGLLGLVDARGGEVATDTIDEEAWEYFKTLYLDPRQPSVKLCHQNLTYINQSQERGWSVPGLRTMQKLALQRIPLPVRVLHREGQAAYDAKCAPYVQTDPDSIAPGEIWIGDHSPFNCWIRHRGKWVRPWITAWQDMRSRLIVGWHVNVGPNQTTILQAMRRGIAAWGPPEHVKIDNGKDYDSEMWTGTTKHRRKLLKAGYLDESTVTGLYAMLGIGISFSIPYHPQSKAIERFFDTLDCQLVKTVPTYCGKDTDRRPEDLIDRLKQPRTIDAAYDLDSFAALVGRYIADVYNVSPHQGAGMHGRSPAAVMAERQSRRVLDENLLDLLLRVWSGAVKIGKNGVRFKGLLYGQYDPELLSRQGQTVRLTYDPDDLSRVWVYDARTLRLLTVAEQNRLVGYGVGEADLREGMKQKQRARRAARQYRDSRLTAHMDLPTLAIEAQSAGRAAPEPETPPTLKPVLTPLHGQLEHHEAVQQQQQRRRASGAENEGLGIDWSNLNPRRHAPDPEDDLGIDWNQVQT